MDRLERIYKLESLLSGGRIRTREELMGALEVSRATFKRDLEYMRDRLNAPIVWDSDARGYRFDDAPQAGPRFQLPGLWFDEQELQAFATMQYLLNSMNQGGPVARQLEPLMARLNTILGQSEKDSAEIKRRVQLLSTTTRRDDLTHFKTVGYALIKRHRLQIGYSSRGSQGKGSRRCVSPQRLIHYRNNWYLGAWCHRVDGIRTFSLDAIYECQVLEDKARSVSESRLAEYYDGGYGIFGGARRKWAKLVFTAEAARYVKDEIWHPDQRSRFDQSGRFHLHVPYSMAQELIMDVMRHGSDVEVLGPPDLRRAVARRVSGLHRIYDVENKD